MRIDVLKWAYEAELPPAIKSGPHAVLLALAYSANFKTEACFPSIQRLVQLTKLGSTAVKCAIATLKKEGLITVKKTKGSHKTNRYTINCPKAGAKASTANDDADQSTDTEMTYAIDGVERTLLLGRGGLKPIGLAKATKLVNAWLEAKGEEWFCRKLEDIDTDGMAKILSDAISMYTEPPKVTFNDIETILTTMECISDWDIVEETIENVKEQATTQQIDNPRAYFLRAIKENIAMGSASLD